MPEENSGFYHIQEDFFIFFLYQFFYKEVFDMEEEKIELTEEMEKELSNGREENEDE